MLTINPVLINKNNYQAKISKEKNVVKTPVIENLPSVKFSNIAGYNNINFKAQIVKKDIEHENYISMTPEQLEEHREKYRNFFKKVNIDELYISRGKTINSKLPLFHEQDMDDFIKVSKCYNQYRDHKIICVGRSPKWFLNVSIWMNGGIEDYTYAAFSSNWFERDKRGLGLKQTLIEEKMPTKEQTAAYKNYLKSINCMPQDIIDAYEKSGKKVIFTDYIHSGCGLASFLDILSKFAEEEGVLEKFANSIKLLTLSSMEYLEENLGLINSYALPTVILPDRLKPFNIEQEYHDMPADVMKTVLIDRNTNECRSTYYPPAAWTIYNPEDYRTGMIPDEILKTMKKIKKKSDAKYTDAMKDYRNLMNFRILDGLKQRGLLKLKHTTR